MYISKIFIENYLEELSNILEWGKSDEKTKEQAKRLQDRIKLREKKLDKKYDKLHKKLNNRASKLMDRITDTIYDKAPENSDKRTTSLHNRDEKIMKAWDRRTDDLLDKKHTLVNKNEGRISKIKNAVLDNKMYNKLKNNKKRDKFVNLMKQVGNKDYEYEKMLNHIKNNMDKTKQSLADKLKTKLTQAKKAVINAAKKKI